MYLYLFPELIENIINIIWNYAFQKTKKNKLKD